jgi:hypothetical protein
MNEEPIPGSRLGGGHDRPAEHEDRSMSEEHWAVTVWRNGEEVVTIATNSLSGRELEPADEECVRTAARHLLAFIGEGTSPRLGGPMTRFRQDNTQGYGDAELGELNAAWNRITSHGGYALEDSDLIHDKSMLDHWSETLLSEYDAGKRGDALVEWFYAP